MTPLEERLRAAIRETAEQIPADPPPLRLNRPGRHAMSAGHSPAGRWRAWTAPVAAAAVVVAVIVSSLALTGGPSVTGQGPARPQTASASVPPYYVALVTGHGEPDEDDSPGVAAEVRATLTGAVLARIVPPKPYATFTGVTASADDRTFVLAAQGSTTTSLTQQQLNREYPNGYVPPARFYLLHIDPASSTRAGRASLQALPASFIPAKAEVLDMALSPDGTLLAANIGNLISPLGTPLYVFNLATGSRRAWSLRTCRGCSPYGGGLGFGGTNVDALSWAADGRHLALVGPGQTLNGPAGVRLLDTNAAGTSLLADSKLVTRWPGANNPLPSPSWRGALITPDEQAVVAVLELVSDRASGGVNVRQELVKVSTATGQVTKLNNFKVVGLYEQILYTSSTGNVLVVTYARPGMSAGILRDGKYTPIPWTNQTTTAAW
jgi:hypothetical protein